MGRWYYKRKATAEESYELRMSYLKKLNMLTEKKNIQKIGWSSSRTQKAITMIIGVYLTNDNPFIILLYTLTDIEGNKTEYKDDFPLLTTNCNFGGIRYWLGCPSCGKRSGVLYLAPGTAYFKCRHCNNLSYNSRNESSPTAFFGITDRKITKLKSEIKRWTWRGRPTRKVQKLYRLQRKMGALSPTISARIEKLNNRIKDANP